MATGSVTRKSPRLVRRRNATAVTPQPTRSQSPPRVFATILGSSSYSKHQTMSLEEFAFNRAPYGIVPGHLPAAGYVESVFPWGSHVAVRLLLDSRVFVDVTGRLLGWASDTRTLPLKAIISLDPPSRSTLDTKQMAIVCEVVSGRRCLAMRLLYTEV